MKSKSITPKKKTSQIKKSDQRIILGNREVRREKNSQLNQFICIECNLINTYYEKEKDKTPLYEEKSCYCPHCQKKTLQICIEDSSLTKTFLELTVEKTPQQYKVLSLIHRQHKGRK